MKKLILITGLGRYKDLVLELIDFFNGGQRFRYKEEAEAIRDSFSDRRLSEVHLVCTGVAMPVFEELQQAIASEYPELHNSIFPLILECSDIACAGDDHEMRDLVYQKVERLAAKSDLVISSGGRKPVTHRLIEAGLLHGCMGYLTITAEGKEVRMNTMEFNILWTPLRRFAEERRPGQLKEELGDNFRSLYLLPKTVIKRLREDTIGHDPTQEQEDLAWLRKLPKADLHCHLGGAFDAELLKGMAQSLLTDLRISPADQQRIRQEMEAIAGKPLDGLDARDLLDLDTASVHPLQNIPQLWQGRAEASHICNAVLVDALCIEQIAAISWHESALTRQKDRLIWYMACGDFGGSGLLQTEANLRTALRWLCEESFRENVVFLEVRFSPDNYTRAGLTIPEVIEYLLDEARIFMAQHHRFQVNFLIMATRHKAKAAMSAHVAAAVTFGQPGDGHGPRVTGFDLAGQEEGNDPVAFQDIFLPLHQHFLNITIHAGEMADDDKIWQAIYLLHARRIGHGLKLVNNPKMMGYVRDHGIAIEMCPSSNRQTNLFRDFAAGQSEGDSYPLRQYLEKGLAVTVNTDNRGISRTTMTDEYLTAARLTKGGLTRWEILRLVKNSFKAAFLPKDEKDRLLKETDKIIFDRILDEYLPEKGE